MNREKAKRYVEYVVDDSGNGREWGEDRHSFVREAGGSLIRPIDSLERYKYSSKLVGWEIPYSNRSPSQFLFVAVHSYLDTRLSDFEAEELARDYLCEIGFFKEGSFPADFVL